MSSFYFNYHISEMVTDHEILTADMRQAERWNDEMTTSWVAAHTSGHGIQWLALRLGAVEPSSWCRPHTYMQHTNKYHKGEEIL